MTSRQLAKSRSEEIHWHGLRSVIAPNYSYSINLNIGEISISIPLHGLIKMWKILLFIPFILTGFVAICYANVNAGDIWAGINVFTLWNCIPLLLAAVMLIPAAIQSPQANRRLRDLWVRIGLAGAILGSTLCVYFTWKFNWWDARTGSSTSALIFIFAPLWTLFSGLIGLGVGWFAQRLIPKRFHSTHLTELNQRAISCYVLVGLGSATAIAYSGLYMWSSSRWL
jgi:hypothetical protein